VLESLVIAAKRVKNNVEIIIANDVMGNPMNGGFVMVRVSDWSRKLLDRWWHAGSYKLLLFCCLNNIVLFCCCVYLTIIASLCFVFVLFKLSNCFVSVFRFQSNVYSSNRSFFSEMFLWQDTSCLCGTLGRKSKARLRFCGVLIRR
jgi:hypothetical protein